MRFIVEGKPQGKARARTVRNKYTGKVHSFTPEKTANYEDLLRWNYKAAGGVYYAEKTLQVDIKAFYPIPKSFSKARRNDAIKGDVSPTTKPDCDNIIKVVLDALNGVAYYDDKQVVSVSCNKYYAERGYTEIEIKEI
jgi:Holliday junction resolvase RusA-like endonuclease